MDVYHRNAGAKTLRRHFMTPTEWPGVCELHKGTHVQIVLTRVAPEPRDERLELVMTREEAVALHARLGTALQLAELRQEGPDE